VRWGYLYCINIGRITGLRWRTIRNVEPDSGDRGGGRKCDRTTNTGQPEDETQRAREPHYTKRERRKLLAILYASHLGKEGIGEGGPVRIGERQRRSTLWRNLDPGIAPSRLKAYIMRELDVIEKVL
jgi:hypothetical protein